VDQHRSACNNLWKFIPASARLGTLSKGWRYLTATPLNPSRRRGHYNIVCAATSWIMCHHPCEAGGRPELVLGMKTLDRDWKSHATLHLATEIGSHILLHRCCCWWTNHTSSPESFFVLPLLQTTLISEPQSVWFADLDKWILITQRCNHSIATIWVVDCN
jgi:hypothetical protein